MKQHNKRQNGEGYIKSYKRTIPLNEYGVLAFTVCIELEWQKEEGERT